MFLKLWQNVKDLLSSWLLEYVPDQFKTQQMCNEAVQSKPKVLRYVPDQFKAQEMWNEVVQINPEMLEFVPDQYKTQKMCNEVVRSVPDPEMLEHVHDQFVILQEMLYEAVQRAPRLLGYVSDKFKAQEMCNKAVQSKPKVLRYVPDYFLTQEMEEFDDDVFITWYKQRKAQKAKIKEELMPVAWHPDRWWDWCMPEDEKQEISGRWS